jgi:hypothetical protein
MGFFYILGVVICLAIALAGALALRWATKLNARMDQFEANDHGRSAVFLGVDQQQMDEVKKVVGANATAFAGNLKLLTADVKYLQAKTKELDNGIVSVANDLADLMAEDTKVSASSEKPRTLPFAT